MLLFGLVLILYDRDRIIHILNHADWSAVPGALLFIALSNCLITLSYIILARRMNIRIANLDLGLIFFTTNIINRLVMSGGIAGFSLRYIMMQPYRVSLNIVLNSSLIHFLLGSLIMLGMLPLVIGYILVTLPVPGVLVSVLIILALIGMLLGVGVVIIIFSERLRSRLAYTVVWLMKKIFGRDISGSVDEYTRRAASAVSALRHDPKSFSFVMMLFLGEWIANVVALNYCLDAFGSPLSFIGAAAIYVIATTAGGITSLPGGVGIQEGMFTSLAVLYGSSFEQAALAAILYRILFTFLPFLLSIVLYPRLLKTESPEVLPSDT